MALRTPDELHTPRTRYENVLIDWDGCLARTLELWISSFDAIYPQFGVNPGWQQIAAHFGDWTAASRFGVVEADMDHFLKLVFEQVERDLPAIDLYPGAERFLFDLRQRGARVALVSSSDSNHVRSAMQRHDIEQYFHAVVSKDDVLRTKPDPEALRLALERMGGSNSSAVMIGDSVNDLGAAQNAAIDSVLFYPPEHEKIYDLARLQLFRPTYICRSFAEIGVLLSQSSASVDVDP